MLKISNIIKKNATSHGNRENAKISNKPAFFIKKVQPKKHIFLGKEISFGIDDYSIQMSAVWHLGKTRKILDIKKDYIPKKDFDQTRKKQFILNKIERFINQHGNKWTNISLTISGKETTFRTFLMPALKKKELSSAIQFEAEKQIPFPIENCNFDFRPTYKILNNENIQYKIAIQAATKTYIDEQLRPFESQGIKVSDIYNTHDVVGQLLKHLSDFKEENNYTLLNIGLNSTEISFYKGSNLEFTHYTSVSSTMLGEQPELTRYEFFAELIANEIQTSLDYYSGQFSTGFSDIIYVYGDLAYSSELLDLLNSKGGIDLEVFPVNELNFLAPKELNFPEVFPVCLPVLASSVCQSSLANLLPPEEKQAQKLAKINSYFKFSLTILFLVLVASWIMMSSKINYERDSLMSTNQQVDLFKNSEAFHTYNLIKRQIAINQSYLDKIKETPSYLNLNLKELSNLTPRSIKLYHLEYQANTLDNNFYLQGVVKSKNIPPEIILAEYVEDLSASPFYEDVSIIRHVKKNVGSQFEIEFHIEMRGII